MAKKKEKHISPNHENLLEGIQKVHENPLFDRIIRRGSLNVCEGKYLGKGNAAIVSSSGYINLNKDHPLSPDEWAYIIAHCQLHLSFGHFDADRLPGYEMTDANGKKTWRPAFDKTLWNIACDIYITKFLSDIKLGKTRVDPLESYRGPLNDEKSIYKYLLENGAPEVGSFGTANMYTADMRGLDEPTVYKEGKKNEYITEFAYALAYSVKETVTKAGGYSYKESRNKTKSELAAEWFVNRYPLLGALASSFKIIENSEVCIENDISVAAVNVVEAKIYINPAAGLNDEELKFVLAHEFLHAGLQHHGRCQGRDPYLWNVACDFVINGWLKEMQIGTMPDCGLYDESLKNVSAEGVYDRIVKDLKYYSKLSTFRGRDGDIIGKGLSKTYTGVSSLDDFYKSALQNGLEYHIQNGRGYIPQGLIEEIKALAMPPIPWDVQLAQWFDVNFAPLEKRRSYARPSRRQGSTPDIPRPRCISADVPENSRTFGVVIDTSGSMSAKLIGYALGAVASYAAAKEVPFARVVFCDAAAYDAGWLSPEDIAGRVCVKGRGGTVLQPAVDLLINSKDFPKNGPILIITDAMIEDDLKVKREHAFLVPKGSRLPFRPKGKVFYFPVQKNGET